MKPHRLVRSALCLALLLLPGTTSAQDDDIIQVPYRGELVDDQSRPISGTFALTFKVFQPSDPETAAWTETQFVAVHEGIYDVVLGKFEPLDAEFAGAEVVIAVEIGELGEVTRHAFELAPGDEEENAAQMPELETMTFADIADRALHADRADVADDCTTLDGHSFDEIDRYEDVMSRISELRAQVGDQGSRIGSETTTLERIGGPGGNPYTRTCPPGYVVTGARGGHGTLVDSIQLVCSQVQ